MGYVMQEVDSYLNLGLYRTHGLNEELAWPPWVGIEGRRELKVLYIESTLCGAV